MSLQEQNMLTNEDRKWWHAKLTKDLQEEQEQIKKHTKSRK